MAEYRIYWFEKENHIFAADDLLADTDASAMAMAMAMAGSGLDGAPAIEVWRGARRIGRDRECSLLERENGRHEDDRCHTPFVGVANRGHSRGAVRCRPGR